MQNQIHSNAGPNVNIFMFSWNPVVIKYKIKAFERGDSDKVMMEFYTACIVCDEYSKCVTLRRLFLQRFGGSWTLNSGQKSSKELQWEAVCRIFNSKYPHQKVACEICHNENFRTTLRGSLYKHINSLLWIGLWNLKVLLYNMSSTLAVQMKP